MVHIGDLIRHAHDAPFRRCRPGALCVGHDAVAHLPRQVQAPAVLFQLVHHTQALHVVLEAVRAQLIQRALPGMAKRRVAQIMGKADCFGQIFVQPQGAGNGPRDLRDLQRMGQSGAVQVSLRREEHLRLLFEPSERLAVQHPVTVTLEHRPDRVLLFRQHAAAALVAEGSPRREGHMFDLFCALTYIHTKSPSLFVAIPPLCFGTADPNCCVCGNCSTPALSKGEKACRFAK